MQVDDVGVAAGAEMMFGEVGGYAATAEYLRTVGTHLGVHVAQTAEFAA